MMAGRAEWVRFRAIARAGDAHRDVTPASAVLVGSIINTAGTVYYYRATDDTWVAGPEIQNSMTIAGNEARLKLTPPYGYDGQDMLFECWMNNNRALGKTKTEPIDARPPSVAFTS